MTGPKLRAVGERLIPSVAYGDAMGLPVETKSAAEIERRYDYIEHLIPPTDNPYYPGNFPAGTTSDDTQLSVGVTNALLAADGFDIQAQASEHL
ncbi:MAG: ADP-ribosylglycohydrolase family protein, partial [Candidatus Saccharimonas sp.]